MGFDHLFIPLTKSCFGTVFGGRNESSGNEDHDYKICTLWIASRSRSLFTHSSMAANEIAAETTPSTNESSIKGSKHTATESFCDDYDLPEEFSDSFLRWINNGQTLCH